jgi:hypothetical protein
MSNQRAFAVILKATGQPLQIRVGLTTLDPFLAIRGDRERIDAVAKVGMQSTEVEFVLIDDQFYESMMALHKRNKDEILFVDIDGEKLKL